MSLDTIMNLTITVESRAPSQAGFGTPLLFGYHTRWLDRRVKEYAQADDMLDDGFDTDDDLYLAAKIVKAQSPSPDRFKIGRRVTPLTQVIVLTPKVTTEGYKYKGTVGGKAFSYTVLAGATLTTVGAGIAALVNTLSVGATAANLAGVVTSTAGTPGTLVAYDFSDTPPDDLEVKDATVDTTTDDELPFVDKYDSDWYGLTVIDSSSKATALNAASWVETKRKLCTVQSADSETLNSGVTDDVFSALKDSSYARTHGIYHRAIGGNEWLAVGWQAGMLTTTPGSATPAFKSVAGVKKDRLQSGEETALQNKFASHYTDINNLGITFEGKSGSGEFVDTVRFIDWVYARMRETVLGILANNPKIPFTDGGVDIMRGGILSVIQLGQAAGGFAYDPAPTVTAPLVKNVPAANKIARILPDVDWTATLAGAIHRMNPVRGRVSV